VSFFDLKILTYFRLKLSERLLSLLTLTIGIIRELNSSKKKISTDDSETEIGELEEEEVDLEHLEHKKKNKHSQSKRENVDEVFRQI
jgi:hypothetical protein